MKKPWLEINVDGLIGPTHHFGGLGVGNLASHASQHRPSNPRAAALEGLAKMQLLSDLGVPQFYLPPLSRPNWPWLASLGFAGDRADILKRCYEQSPQLLSAAYSSAFMWTANAATVAPACDTLNKRLTLVPANLCCNLHRGQESHARMHQLQDMFRGVSNASVTEPLPSVYPLRDEGAANHMRLCNRQGDLAVHLFVYGPPVENRVGAFIARQSELASRQVAVQLELDRDACCFAQQTPEAIEAGVFHNDVIATSHGGLLIYHELAFADHEKVVADLSQKYQTRTSEFLQSICVSRKELPLDEAVRTYLFNSQIVNSDSESMQLICPVQCKESAQTRSLIDRWISDPTNPIQRVHFMSLGQSMANGGGPACLRLRMMIDESQLEELGHRYRIDEARIARLTTMIEREYPDRFSIEDMTRLDFADHAQTTVEAIERLSR